MHIVRFKRKKIKKTSLLILAFDTHSVFYYIKIKKSLSGNIDCLVEMRGRNVIMRKF